MQSWSWAARFSLTYLMRHKCMHISNT
jgi:hypothetical protein